MAIKTSKGLAVFAGCSHPGIEKILTVASKIDPKIYTVFGGLHFADYSDQDVSRTVDDLKNKWNIERIAVGHCTGEFGQAELEKAYRDHHDHAGVGETINLPN
jgi:7,8-dihydropterin-6-yl-methyl-4-(beta-D-ribofuranosyl)aminobenzene 5'-phosphate synthase